MRELYFCRHGITDDLENGIRNRPDALLSPTGHEEARRAAGILMARLVVPQLVVCSALPRAIQTAENIAEVIGYDPDKIVQSELLNLGYENRSKNTLI
ncbi:Phosphoglycerate mutase [candidate division TM7 genomosp. GTL1]|nr:Phosphoglycerate mutase [candidate division TM7 genomosp. GTL1]